MNIEQFFARLKSRRTAALSGGQLMSLALAFLAVVGLTIGSAYWLNTPNYGVLFSDMDAESASSVVAKLKSEKVQYVLDDGGRRRSACRRRASTNCGCRSRPTGMPGSGHVGFEIFDRTAFGVTEFLEHVNYRRALEGELARTISTIAEVASARVHIAMPQPSLFTGRDQPTKASVILKLRNNRPLPPRRSPASPAWSSASVESLRPEAVVIIDNFGRPLSQAESRADAAEVPSGIERQQRIERDLSDARGRSLLEPIVGAGRVRVNVTAQLKPDTDEETEEQWDPTPSFSSQADRHADGDRRRRPAPRRVAGSRVESAAAIPQQPAVRSGRRRSPTRRRRRRRPLVGRDHQLRGQQVHASQPSAAGRRHETLGGGPARRRPSRRRRPTGSRQPPQSRVPRKTSRRFTVSSRRPSASTPIAATS